MPIQREDASAPPTLRTIAKKAGYSTATVSLALRSHPSIPAPTRAKIAAVATELGYRPNPLAVAFQEMVRSRRRETEHTVIAWINDHQERDFWREHSPRDGYLSGAEARAASLGFRVEELYLGNLPAADRIHAATVRQLRARGIRGIILPWVDHGELLYADWSGFCVSVIGGRFGYLARPGQSAPALLLNSVNLDYSANIRLAFDRAQALGSVRTALVINEQTEALTEEALWAGFVSAQRKIPVRRRIPVIVVPDRDWPQTDEFPIWFERHQPDVIICHDATNFRRALLRMGRSVSDGVRLFTLNFTPFDPSESGIDTNHALMASTSVDSVAAQLSRNETGTPPFPKKVLITGTWRNG